MCENANPLFYCSVNFLFTHTSMCVYFDDRTSAIIIRVGSYEIQKCTYKSDYVKNVIALIELLKRPTINTQKLRCTVI